MLKSLLIALHLMNPTYEFRVVTVDGSVYVLDSNLSQDDCSTTPAWQMLKTMPELTEWREIGCYEEEN